MSGGGGNSTTVQKSDPWEGQQPYLRDVFSQARDLYGNGTPAYYPGQTVAGFSPQTMMGLDMMTSRAMGGAPYQNALNNYAMGSMGQQNIDPMAMFGGGMQAMGGIGTGQGMMRNAGNPLSFDQAQGMLGGNDPLYDYNRANNALGNVDTADLNYPRNYIANTLNNPSGFGTAMQQAQLMAPGGYDPTPAYSTYSAGRLSASPMAEVFGASPINTRDVGGNFGVDNIDPQMINPGFNAAQVGSQFDVPQVGNQFDTPNVNAMTLGDQYTFDAGGLDSTARNALAGTASGDLLGGNPYLDAMYDRAAGRVTDQFNNEIMPGLNATFGSAGRTGGGIHALMAGEAAGQLTDSLGDMAASVYGNAYESERGRQMDAASQLGQLSLAEGGQNLAAQTDAARLGLTAGQSNQQAALNAGLANQDAAMQAQQMGLNADLANQQAGMQGLQLGLNADLANQDTTMQAQQMGLNANLANQQAGLTAGQANQQAALQSGQMGLDAQLANQQSDLLANQSNQDAALRAQQLGITAGQANQQNALNTFMANQDAAARAGQMGLDAQLANQQAGLTGAGMDLQGDLAQMNLAGDLYQSQMANQLGAAQLGGDLFSARNAADLGRMGMANDLFGNVMQNQLGMNSLAAGMYGDSMNRMLQGGLGLTNAGLTGLGSMNDLYSNIGANQYRGASMAPTLANMDYNDINNMIGAGNMIQDQSQNLIDADMARHNYYQQMPQQMLNNYASTINGLPAGLGTTTSNMNGPSNTGAGLMGGAMMGAGLGSMMLPAAAGFGAFAPYMMGGALLGGLI